MKTTALNVTGWAGLAAMGNEGIAMFPIRLTAVAGLASAVVLFVNAAKRAGLIPISAATQLVAPLAQALAIILVVGLAALAMRQSSKYSSVALAVNVLGLAADSIAHGIGHVWHLPVATGQHLGDLAFGEADAGLSGTSLPPLARRVDGEGHVARVLTVGTAFDIEDR